MKIIIIQQLSIFTTLLEIQKLDLQYLFLQTHKHIQKNTTATIIQTGP